LLNGFQSSDTPFLHRDAVPISSESSSSSPSSSIKSVAVANGVVDPKKKANLMNELFGANTLTEISSKQTL
jgi:hypothetical protein